jgi:ATP-dependent helicase/nuclease subunit A
VRAIFVSTQSVGNAQPIDKAQREAALDPTQSFCVTAPAGSGKTELLSQRVLALLAYVQQPEEILAITFTRKAAAEMRERILLALHAAELDEPSEEHKRLTWRLARTALMHAQARNWNLLQNPQRLRVQTIDGLCGSLTAQMPVLSQFGGQPRITERAQPLYREAIDALLLQLETNSDIADSLGALLLHLDNRVERLQELLAGLLARRDQWLPHISVGVDRGGGSENKKAASEAVRAHLERTLQHVRADALLKLCEAMQGYRAEVLSLLDFSATCLSETKPDHALCNFKGCVDLPDADPEAVIHWQSISNWLLTQKGEWRKKFTVNEGFPAASGANKALYQERKSAMEVLLEAFAHDDELLQALQEVRYLPTAMYPDAQWQILVQLTRVLAQAVAQLQVVFQVRGEVDFTEISICADKALGQALNPSELMLRLDQRISHLLIDEFQDTSSTQFRLLKRLVEGWREHNESGGEPRTLFIVGDGMQSIYGFREAKVGLFLEARDEGVNELELIDAPLQVNFRSTPAIVNWNNRVFAQSFPQVQHIPRGAVCYEHSHAFKPDDLLSEVKIFGIRNDPDRVAEAQRVIELVQQSLEKSADGEVAILVRSRPHLHAIVPALQRAGIAFRATDIDPLMQRAHVQDLLALLKALLNPADRIAWLAVLRSPLIGLDNRELHIVANGSDSFAVRVPLLMRLHDANVLAQFSGGTSQRLQKIAALIDTALQQRQRKPIRSWIEGIWLALGGEFLTRNENAIADVQVLLDLIEQCGDELHIDELEQRLQSLYARPEHDLSARVVVMTIHKSKGLEFDTVIVPALDAGGKSDDKPLLRWSEYLAEDGSLGIAIAANAAIGGESDAIYRWLEYESKQQKQLEDTRLLYVAATRAIKRLYLVFRTKDAEEFKSPATNSLLCRIWPAVQSEVIWSDAASALISGHEVDEEVLVRVPLDWHLQHERAMQLTVTENVPAAIAYSLEAMVGTALHRLLELLARYGIAHWLERSVREREVLVTQILQQIAVSREDIAPANVQVIAAIETMLADQRGRWLLSNEHSEAVAEWDLISAGKRYVIDRSFVEVENALDRECTRWIIDYKNSAPRVDESIEKFVQREMDSYRAQLLLYRELVSSFDKRKIRTALYFPRVAHWVEVA